MSFLEHLAELRQRLRNAAIAFALALGVAVYFRDELFDFLTRPVREAWVKAGLGEVSEFHFASMTEPFWVYMKLCLLFALIGAAPFIFWEVWKFIAPGLYKKEKKLALAIAVATGGCFSLGAVFGYRALCPPAAYYMLTFAKSFPGAMPFKIEATLMMNNIISFLLMMLAGCGVAFELPVIIALLGGLGIVTARGLWRFNKFALILSAIVGGILTPGPDILSQLLMAGPLFVLYNLGIVIVWIIERSRKKTLDAIEKEHQAEDAREAAERASRQAAAPGSMIPPQS